MPPVTPRKLKSCLTSSPSDCSSPTSSIKSTSSKATTATPPTPYSSGGSSCYSTPTPTRRHKKSVRFKAEEELAQVKQYIPAKPAPTEVVPPKRKKEEVADVRKTRKRKEASEDSYFDYTDPAVSKIIESGPAGLGITVDHTYGPPTKAPPQAPLPRPTKRERTKYSQSPTTKSVDSPPPPPPPKSTEAKMTYSFDDSTSTSTYPDRSFGQAPPAPVPALNSSFTEIASYPPVPQIMSSGYSFTEQNQPDQSWWAYQEPEQPPMVAAASRPLRRKRSFEARKASDSRMPSHGPEIVDMDSMRSHRGTSSKSSSSSKSSKSSKLPTGPAYKEAKPESSSRTSSRRRREEEEWAEQYRLETLKKQARQKTRDREIKKHARADPHAGSFSRDASAGYFNHKAAAYSFNADEGYGQYF